MRVAEFGAVQIAVQLLTAAAGLLVVRSLAKEQYTLYAIAFQMQTTCNLLATLGIGIGVRSIGGRVWKDRERLGQLVSTALQLRQRFAVISLLVVMPIAAWMLRSNNAEWPTVGALCGVLVAGLIPLLSFNVYAIVPQLHGELRRIQSRDLLIAIVRLSMISVLAVTCISAVLAAAVGAVGNWLQNLITRPWAQTHANPAAPRNSDDHEELVRLSMRQLPNTLFFCFQGQVVLLVLSWFGNTNAIAEAVALGRLGILTTVFHATITNTLAPPFSKTASRMRGVMLYAFLVVCLALLLALALAALLAFPQLVPTILGESYAGLTTESLIAVLGVWITSTAAMLWTLNQSRAWVGWTQALVIPLTLVGQSVFVAFADVSSLRGALIFSLVAPAFRTGLLAIDAFSGFGRNWQGKQASYG